MINLQALRLPATDETLRFLSPHFAQPHVWSWLDDRTRSCYGLYAMLRDIRAGSIRVYGAFDAPDRFLGCTFGALEEDGESFELHSAWQRKVDVKSAVLACERAMVEDYRKDGIVVRYAVGYIPECIRAARLGALRAGGQDCGPSDDKRFIHDGVIYQCRKFRKELR